MRACFGEEGNWSLYTLLEFSNLTRYKTDVAFPSLCYSTTFLYLWLSMVGSACMTRRGVKIGTCFLLFTYATWKAVSIRATCSSELFDPDVFLVASNCTYINITRHRIVRVAVGARGIAPSLEAQP